MGSVEEAFKAVPRRNFLPDEFKAMDDLDEPLPIGFGQTCSQPTTVARMLGWLEAEPGNRVLDVGSGSGWTTALLAHIVGPTGFVYASELVPELVDFGRENCKQLGIKNVLFHVAVPHTFGLPMHGPYDCILVSACADYLPEELVAQLKPGGKLVIPVGNDILEITKTTAKHYDTLRHFGYVFVPLVKN